jgi:hypothetical protein
VLGCYELVRFLIIEFGEVDDRTTRSVTMQATFIPGSRQSCGSAHDYGGHPQQPVMTSSQPTRTMAVMGKLWFSSHLYKINKMKHNNLSRDSMGVTTEAHAPRSGYHITCIFQSFIKSGRNNETPLHSCIIYNTWARIFIRTILNIPYVNHTFTSFARQLFTFHKQLWSTLFGA